jgi:predicted  nucleic acid-binding Zn-ribbon protein
MNNDSIEQVDTGDRIDGLLSDVQQIDEQHSDQQSRINEIRNRIREMKEKSSKLVEQMNDMKKSQGYMMHVLSQDA